MRSYLTNRQQRVLVNNTMSHYGTITHGVPQGSCLGPLLFLMFINDLTTYVPSNSIMLYADDTVLYTTGKNIADIQGKLQRYLDITIHWTNLNKLTINSAKTKTMLFNRTANTSKPQLKLEINQIYNSFLALWLTVKEGIPFQDK